MLFSFLYYTALSGLNTIYPTAAPGDADNPTATGTAAFNAFGSNLGNKNSFNLLGSIYNIACCFDHFFS